MNIIRLAAVITVLAAGLTGPSCTRIHYIGTTYEPTDAIDIYYSAEMITRDYEVIGHASGSADYIVSGKRIQAKLEKHARAVGADAIIITGVQTETAMSSRSVTHQKLVEVTLIRYI